MDVITFQTLISPVSIGVAGIVGLSSLYVMPWLWRHQQMAVVRKHASARRLLALTFDDGPSVTATPELLDLLKSYQARATFFMLGKHAQEHPDIVDRVIREGHEVGCHSDQHLNAWKVTPWRAIKDIERGYEHLAPWIPRNAPFRPPYGKITLPTQRAVLRRGAPIWWWTIDSYDTLKVLPSPVDVAESLREAGGGIVLLHDGSLTPRSNERRAFTLAATAALLDCAKREGISSSTLGNLWK